MRLDESNFHHHAAALYRGWREQRDREVIAAVENGANVKVEAGSIFKVSDTPTSGPEKNSGHSGTPDPPNNKEIA
jgi:hypothetical protein